MSVIVKHPFVSAVADSADTSLVRPSNWNADHTIIGLGTAAELNAGVANGVATLDSGGKVPVSELPAAVLGALSYQGTWNASTNTPTLASGVGTKGYYYVVSVAGSTNLDGVTDWLVGDWAVYNGTAWQKVDNTDQVTSVNGQTGTVVLTTTDVAEGTNEYFTTARARASVSAGTGISYDNGTGVITNSAPDQTVALTDGTAIDVTGTYPNFTINNTAPDQTVVLNAGTGISTSGTYPSFTITNTSPSLGGDVVGPASATDNAIARYDTTIGKLIQNSVVIIDDTGSVTGVNALTSQSLTVNNNATLGSSNTDTLDVNARITTDLEPNANNAKDIGTSGRNWRDAFFGRTLHTVNLDLTGTTSFDGAQGTSGQVLTSAGTGNTPTWTTPTTGTVTSVGGTGTVNGITLTGTVTTSGNLTLGGTLSLVSPPAIGSTTPNTGSFSSLTDSGNLNFTGTGNRITGDFSNATIANRVVFQSSTVNGQTRVSVMPNGTESSSAIDLFNNSSDMQNAGLLSLRTGSADMAIVSNRTGTGTYLPMTFITGGSERARIDTSGNLLVGTTNVNGRISSVAKSGFSPAATAGTWSSSAGVSSSGSFGGGISWIDGSGGYCAWVDDGGTDFNIAGGLTSNSVANGVFLNGYAATSWSGRSDERLKQNLKPITDALNKTCSLRAVTGAYKNFPNEPQAFLLAQDVQKVLPEAVCVADKNSPEQYLGLAYTQVIPLLVAAIQELKAEIDLLKGN